MSKDDIEKAVKDAEQFAAEDKKRREEVDTKNAADQMVYQAEKTLTEAGDKIDAAEKDAVQKDIDALKEALKGTDVDMIKAAQEKLQQSLMKVGEKIYNAAQQQASSGAGAPNEGPKTDENGNVYDAEFHDVDDDKK